MLDVPGSNSKIMAEPVINSVEESAEYSLKEITVTAVPTECISNNVVNTCQTIVVHNHHPTHNGNHSFSDCRNRRTNSRRVKQKHQKHKTSCQSPKVGTDYGKGFGYEGYDVENQHQQHNSLNVCSLKCSGSCKRCTDYNSVTNKNQPTASILSVHHENSLSDSETARRSSTRSASLSTRHSRSSEKKYPGKENEQNGRNTSAGAEGQNDHNRARSRGIPGRENLWRRRNTSAARTEDDHYDHRAKDHDMIKRKQKKPFRDKQFQLAVDHGPLGGPLGQSKVNEKDGNMDFSNTKQQLRDLTNLPPSEIRRPTTLVTYPAKRSKGSGKGGNRRGQANRAGTSRGAEGTPEPPIQVTDTSSESLQRPPRDRIVTSTRSVYGSLTATILPIPSIGTIEQEQMLISRMRGERRTTSNQDLPVVAPRHPTYATPSARQESFHNWPSNTGQDPSRMSMYGFYYSGQTDLIRCFQCGIGLKDWSSGDEPLFEHIRHSPQCPFLRDLLGNDLLNAYRENLNIAANRPATNAPNSGDRIRNPDFETLQSRLASFDSWPSTASQTPQHLAEAGLFYTGFNDLCRCFHCDGGLQRWESEDTPWVEHARWFPHCAYVKQIKGQAYINMVRRAAEEAQREDQDPPVYANKVRERQVGSQTRERQVRSQTRERQVGSQTGEQSADNLTLYYRGLNEAGMGAVELGFSRIAVQQAIETYNRRDDRRGVEYNTEDLVNMLTARIDNGETLPTDPSDDDGSSASNLDPEEENKRLKGFVKCMMCEINDTNMLFLPCTHHRLCEACAEAVTHCPVCNRWIEDKIKTYMS